jgi:hypothetical protein
MRRFLSSLAVVAVTAFLLSMPARAQEQEAAEAAPSSPFQELALQIEADAQMKSAQANYKAATDSLSDEQKKELTDLEREFASTMAPDMEIMSRGGELEYCAANDGSFKGKEEGYAKAFAVWRDGVNAEQDKLWAAHRSLRQKIAYVDQAVLDDYYLFQKKLMVQLIGIVTMTARDQGAFAKADCTALAAALDAVEAPTAAQE